MSCRPSCMLSHDLANKLAAIVAHCQILEINIEVGSPSYARVEKVKSLALQMGDMLHTRECELHGPTFSLEVNSGETVRMRRS
jgi:hypothetical protein